VHNPVGVHPESHWNASHQFHHLGESAPDNCRCREVHPKGLAWFHVPQQEVVPLRRRRHPLTGRRVLFDRRRNPLPCSIVQSGSRIEGRAYLGISPLLIFIMLSVDSPLSIAPLSTIAWGLAFRSRLNDGRTCPPVPRAIASQHCVETASPDRHVKDCIRLPASLRIRVGNQPPEKCPWPP
jgi:hypothetical protein